MKIRKFLIALIALLGLVGVSSVSNQVKAASINTLAKKYQYSGVTYLYKMLKLEGIKYNKFPGVEYQMASQKELSFMRLTIPELLLTMKQSTLTASGKISTLTSMLL